MLRVTFYSYKGGVGRTLALLNVAAILAMAGRRVVAVDMDLEAPGFELSTVSGSDGTPRPGLSDFVLRFLDGNAPESSSIAGYAYPAAAPELRERLTLIPAGTRSVDFARRLTGLYGDPAGDAARVFELLVADVAATLSPDYLLFDSRTGLSDTAGVCTVELPEVLVAVSGLNEQNVAGMERALSELRRHPARGSVVATLLALGPVPQRPELDVIEMRLASSHGGSAAAPVPLHVEPQRRRDPLFDAILRAQIRLLGPILRELGEVQQRFPRLTREDLFHALEYDPSVPLGGELQGIRGSRLGDQYRALARSLTRAHPRDEVLAGEDARLLPILLDDRSA